MPTEPERIARIGRLEEQKAAIAARQAAEIRAFARQHIESRIATGNLDPEQLERSIAEVAPEKFRARCRAARTGRRVTIRPAADGMADPTAHLPAEEAVAAYAALAKTVKEVAVQPQPVTRSPRPPPRPRPTLGRRRLHRPRQRPRPLRIPQPCARGRDWYVSRDGDMVTTTTTTTTPTGARYAVRIGTTARKASTQSK